MKDYFDRLQKIGQDAIVDLRKLDAEHIKKQRSYLEARQKGDMTEQGYQKAVRELDAEYQKKTAELKAQVAGVQREFEAAMDEHMTPCGTAIDAADMEILKHFKLTPAEFDRLAEKHRSNPTMGRLLEDYRVEHDVKTDWRYQDGEKRKAIFRSACGSIESIMGQLDKFCPDREGSVARCISSAYHRLPDSDPAAFQVAPAEPATPGKRPYALF